MMSWLKGKEVVAKTRLAVELKKSLDTLTSRGYVRKKTTDEFISVNITTEGNLVFTLGVGDTDEQSIELTKEETKLLLMEIEGRMQ